MSEPSAEYVNAYRMAREGAFRRGEIAVSRMSRLAPLLCNDEGKARFELDFQLDSRSRPLVTGRVRATLELTCQRCLEPMRLDLDLELRLGIVRSYEESVALCEDCEPLILNSDSVSLTTVVEDELILGLPAAPHHPPGSCRPPAASPSEEEASKVSQFSDLAGVARKRNKTSE